MASDTRAEFFKEAVEVAKAMQDGPKAVISLPVWGWVGDGKTTSILTALHYCDPSIHGFGFAFVNDDRSLQTLLADNSTYRQLGLADRAAATKIQLGEHYRKFIDDCEWPLGTDEAFAYVLGVRGVRGIVAYLVLPDLTGGNYRAAESPAQAALSTSHGVFVLVDPRRYSQTDTEAKFYRDEISGVLEDCRDRSVPAALLLAKTDLYIGKDCLKESQDRLTVVAQAFGEEGIKIFPVSAIGDELNAPVQAGAPPPPPGDRRPQRLIESFVWLLREVVNRGPDPTIVPEVNYRLPAKRVESFASAVTPVAELRSRRAFSEAPGDVLLQLSSRQGADPEYLFLAENGDLLRVALGEDSPKIDGAGGMPDFDGSGLSVRADVVDGVATVGTERDAKHVWAGSLGDSLARLALPFQARSWRMLHHGRLLAIDAEGTLHVLELANQKWVSKDYVQHCIQPTNWLTCAALRSQQTAVVFNGEQALLFDLSQGRLGQRSKAASPPKFDTPVCLVNESGTWAVARNDGSIWMGTIGSEELLQVGVGNPELPQVCLAPDAARVAWVSPEGHLCAASIREGEVYKTSAPPVLDAGVRSMAWERGGGALVVVLDEMSAYSIYVAFGL